MELTVDGEPQLLAAGDCLRFVAETTRFRCPGPGEARYVLVVVVP